MGISTHILDVSRGRPAGRVGVSLERETGGGWTAVGAGATDDDGRCRTLLADGTPPQAGTYRLTFAVDEYFGRTGTEAFYPAVSVQFRVRAGEAHYHVPLLLSPFGYSTYRGS